MSDTTQKWEVPADVQEQFRKMEVQLTQLTLQLGKLAVTYEAQKNTLLAQMDQLAKARIDAVTAAAKAAGLDMNEAWTLDTAQMQLTKQARA